MHQCTKNSQKLLGLQGWTFYWWQLINERWERCHSGRSPKSHEGINKAMLLARTCVYWPGMEADITDYIKRCLTCIDSSNLPVETLHPHEVPPGPWVKIGMDFFQDDFGRKHLIVADYFSKFPYIYHVASSQVPCTVISSFSTNHIIYIF